MACVSPTAKSEKLVSPEKSGGKIVRRQVPVTVTSAEGGVVEVEGRFVSSRWKEMVHWGPWRKPGGHLEDVTSNS